MNITCFKHDHMSGAITVAINIFYLFIYLNGRKKANSRGARTEGG